jgi:hypothetical protein
MLAASDSARDEQGQGDDDTHGPTHDGVGPGCDVDRPQGFARRLVPMAGAAVIVGVGSGGVVRLSVRHGQQYRPSSRLKGVGDEILHPQ